MPPTQAQRSAPPRVPPSPPLLLPLPRQLLPPHRLPLQLRPPLPRPQAQLRKLALGPPAPKPQRLLPPVAAPDSSVSIPVQTSTTATEPNSTEPQNPASTC